MSVKLAEALLRRKELQGKVDQLKQIKQDALFKMQAKRISVNDSLDDVQAAVPILEVNQVTAEFDFYARQLRLIDSAIQQANWTCEVTLTGTEMSDYKKD